MPPVINFHNLTEDYFLPYIPLTVLFSAQWSWVWFNVYSVLALLTQTMLLVPSFSCCLWDIVELFSFTPSPLDTLSLIALIVIVFLIILKLNNHAMHLNQCSTTKPRYNRQGNRMDEAEELTLNIQMSLNQWQNGNVLLSTHITGKRSFHTLEI